MNRILAIISAVALALCLGLTLHVRTLQTKIDLRNSEIDALRDDLWVANAATKRAKALAAVRAKDLTTARSELAAAQSKVHHALEANRSWADAPLPDGVYKSLSGPRTAPQ